MQPNVTYLDNLTATFNSLQTFSKQKCFFACEKINSYFLNEELKSNVNCMPLVFKIFFLEQNFNKSFEKPLSDPGLNINAQVMIEISFSKFIDHTPLLEIDKHTFTYSEIYRYMYIGTGSIRYTRTYSSGFRGGGQLLASLIPLLRLDEKKSFYFYFVQNLGLMP